jgi:hypothetical protein
MRFKARDNPQTKKASWKIDVYQKIGAESEFTTHQHQNDAKANDFAGQKKSHLSGIRHTMGWLMGLEPTTTGITILDSTN